MGSRAEKERNQCQESSDPPEFTEYSQHIMEQEDDDDIYASATANSSIRATRTSGTNAFPSQAVNGQTPADLEEGEEEDGDEEEESDSVY